MASAAEPGVKLPHETVVGLLDAVEWFANLTAAEVEELAASAETLSWNAGDIIFNEGEVGDRCYIVHTGSVRVLRCFPDGRRIVLAKLGANNIFGELALLGSEKRSATIQAAEETVAVALEADRVLAILRTDAEAALSVAASLADRLRATNERLFEYSISSVSGRIIATLLSVVEARQSQGAGDTEVEVTGSPVDFARLSGADRESATRVLMWLENQGIITLKRGRVLVHDALRLAKQLR